MFGIHGSNYSDLTGGAHPCAYIQVLNVFAQAKCVCCHRFGDGLGTASSRESQ